MTELRARMIRQMQLHRLAESTQEGYLYYIRALTRFCRRAPDELSIEEIQSFLHYLLTERKLAWSTVNLAMCAIVFFYIKVLGWDRLSLKLPPRKRPQKLPGVWSREDMEKLFDAVRPPKNRILLMTIYSAGLRVSEAMQLSVDDLDTNRMTIRVRQGKGHKDRDTLLSPRLLQELRSYWRLYHRGSSNRVLFPGRDPSRPLEPSTIQKGYAVACERLGVSRKGGIHSLRHSFASHLLESGVDVRTIQMLLGHRSITTTSRYMQVARQRLLAVRSPFDLLPTPGQSPPSTQDA